MQRYRGFVCLSFVVASVWVESLRSQELPAIFNGQTPVQEPQVAEPRPATSVFNDRLRRFKFELEHVSATQEAAESFVLRYSRPDNPRIVGAYPDDQTNSLVVIGPPESEQAIRENLAEWFVESQGAGAAPLNRQLRLLERQRQSLLEEMAEMEVLHIEVAAGSEAAKAQQIADRLQTFEGKVHTVERQIQVVRKYIDRLGHDQPARATNTGKPASAP